MVDRFFASHACRWSTDHRCPERMVSTWSEVNEAERVEAAAVVGARKHVGNEASVCDA